MAMPTLEKTWSFYVNQSFFGADANNDAQLFWYGVKEELANNMVGCSIAGSSDSITAGMDGADRIGSATEIVGTTGAHSWIVIKFANIGGLSWLIDFSTANEYQAAMYVSLAGFTGGTTSTRPTATDEQLVQANTAQTVTSAHQVKRLHLMHSTDGQQVRIVNTEGGNIYGWFHAGVAADAITGWSTNVWVSTRWQGSSATNAMHSASLWSSSSYGYAWHGSVAGAIYLSAEGANGASLMAGHTYPNDISGEWPIIPIGIWSPTATMRGRHGRIPDLWFGSASANDGDTMPGDGSRAFAQFNDLIFPWNGSTPLLS